MNGAEALLRTAAAAGLDLCLANPGTTEMPLVTALDRVRGIRSVLGLFEGVCTGAADGYARVTGRPALTLLHLGPGLANGLANLHNARRAHSPVLNLVGDHTTWHRPFDAPLSSDIESLARPVSAWVQTSAEADALPADFSRALAAALLPPGQVATLVVPADCQWGDAAGPASPPPPAARAAVPAARVEAARSRLRAGRSALLLGGVALREDGLRAAARVGDACGATLLCETFPARLERGRGLPRTTRLPYFPEHASAALADFDVVLGVGCPEPVAFFGYPGGRSRLVPQEKWLSLAAVGEDVVAALSDLADALGAAPRPAPGPQPALPGLPSGRLDAERLGAVLAARQPDGAVVVDEGATSGAPWWQLADAAPPHATLTLTGGAIGQGLPCATGAALARPERPVIALQADGSGLYTLQALWTQAREGLHVVTLVCANQRYRILQIELARAGVAEPGPKALALTDLGHPQLDWVSLARGFGVPATRVESADQLDRALSGALAEPGPHLIEALL